MSTKSQLETIKKNAEIAEKTVLELKDELKTLTTQYNSLLVQKLREENQQLTIAIEEAKKNLIQLEVKNGTSQVSLPKSLTSKHLSDNGEVTAQPQLSVETVSNQKEKDVKEKPNQSLESAETVHSKKEKKVKEVKEKPNSELPADVGRLDFRIGKIVDVQKHPDADSLYVLKINCGETNPRTVCSGLVKFVSLEALQNRIVLLLCNLKPVKMRGITSEAMVMCASTSKNVEVLSPPEGSVPGDLVYCEGYERNPDPIMNPKKKIFETVVPDLATNDTLQACYKGVPLEVTGKGTILAATLKNSPVK